MSRARTKRRAVLADLARVSPAFTSTSGLPSGPGVYRFRDDAGRALYIGRATDLRRRVRSYWQDVGDRRHLVRMVPRIARVEAVACVSAHEAAWLERNLLEHRMPPWNRTAGGQEVPCWLQLHDDVRLSHDTTGDGRSFGPYLGGEQVRRAASGLRRVFPLRYATGRLTGAEREMARMRGVDDADPVALRAAIVAVLDRDPAAVAAVNHALVARRDAAAEVMAYELAATIQAELHAIAWVTAPQRVTGVNGDDGDVHGWHEGTLVRFAVRGGRVREWAVTACGGPAAAARISETPERWREFAATNAALAARLRGQVVTARIHER